MYTDIVLVSLYITT